MESRKPAAKDFYAVLGLPSDCSPSEIKKAYRALAHQYHPDRLRSETDTAGAAEKMILINEAFEVLSDVKQRASYDRERSGEKVPTPSPAPMTPEDFQAHIAPPKPAASPKPAPPSSAVNQTVTRDFLAKIKSQVMQESAEKLHPETEKDWLWALSAKTWSANFWVSLRLIPNLNANVARELLVQLQALIAKRQSGWRKNFFVFVLAYQGLNEGDAVLKLFRGFCVRPDVATARNTVNIIVFDANLRRSVVCGKRSSETAMNSILRGLGVS